MNLPHAVIAGAGIGGLCTALCLARVGWRVSLYEKAKILDETGAGLQLSPNASAILRRLGVLERLAPFALAPEAIRIRRARDGATLARMPLDGAQARWGAPYLTVHRADLQRALLEAAALEGAIRLQTGAAVVGFASTQEGVAVAIAQDAVRLKEAGDCLIGADGLRSFVRHGFFADHLRFSGRTAWRTTIEAACVPAAMHRQETNLWLGRKAHLVHYPLRGGTIVNVVAIVDEDFRPGEEDFWSSPGDPKFLEVRFAGWDKSARDLLGAASDWRKWPLADRDCVASFVSGRVALIGDAAHPMLPFLAQGAAQAIEDASVLGEVLGRGQNIEAGLRAYQEKRLPRVARVQKESRRQATIYHLGGPAAFLRDAALRVLGPEKMLARYDWLYDARDAGGREE
jgi:2-polyprenyl-6-methoxyphenol hydroxylase-like FAD-dependent oxidoreductase